MHGNSKPTRQEIYWASFNEIRKVFFFEIFIGNYSWFNFFYYFLRSLTFFVEVILEKHNIRIMILNHSYWDRIRCGHLTIKAHHRKNESHWHDPAFCNILGKIIVAVEEIKHFLESTWALALVKGSKYGINIIFKFQDQFSQFYDFFQTNLFISVSSIYSSIDILTYFINYS